MTEEQRETFLDLLMQKAVYGLDAAEQAALDEIDPGTSVDEFASLEITAAAIGMAGLSELESLPPHLAAKIAANAAKIVGTPSVASDQPWPPKYVDDEKPNRPWFAWLGWAAAAAACIALAVNVYVTSTRPPVEVVKIVPAETPRVLTPAEERDAMMARPSAIIKAVWAAGNVKDMKDVSGDIVWSDETQTGFMRLRGLAVNDPTATCYQLWIYDTVQDKATPIDGGIFDVTTNGEIIMPINAKLRAEKPYKFALTIERHGGVVQSKGEKIAALATVESGKI